MDTLGNVKRRRTRPEQAPQAEWGDVRDAQRLFGLKESMAYKLVRDGLVETALICDPGKKRGKRLISFVSLRKLLSSLAAAEALRGSRE